MSDQERRGCKRYKLNHPFCLTCIGEDGELMEFNDSQVLDAGAGGMRLEIPGGESLAKGAELVLQCLPCKEGNPLNQNYPVAVHVEVVWNEPDSKEVGFAYRV